jgi:hypothetical protein
VLPRPFVPEPPGMRVPVSPIGRSRSPAQGSDGSVHTGRSHFPGTICSRFPDFLCSRFPASRWCGRPVQSHYGLEEHLFLTFRAMVLTGSGSGYVLDTPSLGRASAIATPVLPDLPSYWTSSRCPAFVWPNRGNGNACAQLGGTGTPLRAILGVTGTGAAFPRTRSHCHVGHGRRLYGSIDLRIGGIRVDAARPAD